MTRSMVEVNFPQYIHREARDFFYLTLRPLVPGADPVAALAHELAAGGRLSGLDWTLRQVRDQLSHDDGLALLAASGGGRRRRLLVVVDQFEELLTQTAPAAARGSPGC